MIKGLTKTYSVVRVFLKLLCCDFSWNRIPSSYCCIAMALPLMQAAAFLTGEIAALMAWEERVNILLHHNPYSDWHLHNCQLKVYKRIMQCPLQNVFCSYNKHCLAIAYPLRKPPPGRMCLRCKHINLCSHKFITTFLKPILSYFLFPSGSSSGGTIRSTLLFSVLWIHRTESKDGKCFS